MRMTAEVQAADSPVQSELCWHFIRDEQGKIAATAKTFVRYVADELILFSLCTYPLLHG
eukprot:SAG31_NODE_4633_length_3083_cov_5.088807_4_plen_59_part_00